MEELLAQLCQELNSSPAQVVQKALKLLSHLSTAQDVSIVINGTQDGIPFQKELLLK